MRRFKQNITSSNPKVELSRREFVLGSGALSLGLLPIGLSLSQRASAENPSDFFISTTGSDSNPGTRSQPWAITAITTKRAVYAGKRLGLLDGIYYVAALATPVQNPDRILLDVASGTASSPTVVQSVNPQGAIIDGTDGQGNRVNSYFNNNGCGLIGQTYLTPGDVGYVTLKDLVVRNGFRYLIHFRYNAGIADGPRFPGVVIDSCDVSDIHLDGRGVGDNTALIMGYTTEGMIVRNCRIYNARGDRTVNDANGYGIQTWSCNNSVFEFNTITNCREGIYVKNNYQTGCTIRNNYINLSDYTGAGSTTAILGLGFSKKGLQHVSAHHNVLVAQNGWRVTADLSTILQGPSQFYNNTVVAIGSDFGAAGVEMYGNTYAESFYNNILSHTGTSGSEMGDFTLNASNPGVVDYNCYPSAPKISTAPSGGMYPSKSYSSLSALQAGTRFDPHSISTNPLFLNSGNEAARYRLQSGSPCIGVGRVGGLSTGTVVDLGAWSAGVSQVGSNFNRVVPMAPAVQIS